MLLNIYISMSLIGEKWYIKYNVHIAGTETKMIFALHIWLDCIKKMLITYHFYSHIFHIIDKL